MGRFGMGMAVLACCLAQPAWGESAAVFQQLAPDAQLIVNRVSGDKPADTAICAVPREDLRGSLVQATQGLYFGGSLAGDPREAGTAAAGYFKALCRR